MDTCIPVKPNSKPKQTPEFKFERLLKDTSKPSVMAAVFFHMLRRFMAGKHVVRGDINEEFIFGVLKPFTTENEFLKCILRNFDSLPQDTQDRLFDSRFLGDINSPNDPEKIRDGIAQEVLHYAKADDTDECASGPRPGLVRTQQKPEKPNPPAPVLICKINGQNPQDGIEIKLGSNVVIEGMNFYDTDTKVRFDNSETHPDWRDLDVIVCGDTKTPLTEIVNGREVPIVDCRVHDRLSFHVPTDMRLGWTKLSVAVPNPNHEGGWDDPMQSNRFSVNIVEPSPERFEIASETLYCKDETHADWLGSDEVGISIAAVPVSPDFYVDEIQWASNAPIEFGNVDTGNRRPMDFILFAQQKPMSGVSILIRGWEIDGRSQLSEAQAAFENVVRHAVTVAQRAYDEAEDECDKHHVKLPWYLDWNAIIGRPPPVEPVDGGGIISTLLAIAAVTGLMFLGFVKSIDCVNGVWGPADPIIGDRIVLSPSYLLQLTNPNVPLPEPSEYEVNGIKVIVTPLEKRNNQYWETREYISDDEGSKYQIKLRYTRTA